ncbi:MAG: cardiolipin synthase [Calditrichaeota bacterium]|nr:cardiolipin synthase [Calditrichota bacterium]RQW06193.1 MAG: cardiolipin synthase [Calditrichota bacterium]
MDHLFIIVLLCLYLISLVLIPVVVNKRKRPVVTLAWIMAIIFLPYLGAAMFLIFGTERIVNKGRVKLSSNDFLKKLLQDIEEQWAPDIFTGNTPDDSIEALQHIIRISEKYSFFKVVADNSVEFLVDSEQAYPSMEDAIRSAENHINMEFYIFEADNVGHRFKDLLIQQSRKGVKVHFLYDSLGSMNLNWNRKFLNELTDAGVKVSKFLPINEYVRPWNINLRNHRKLMVVDNRVGFTGSLNIGETFVAKKDQDFGEWRETFVKIEGPAVSQLQWIFCEDWYFSTGEELISREYFTPADSRGDALLQMVASGPDVREKAIYKIFLTAIYQARYYVYVTTPYFIPDRSLFLALQLTASRGVDVRILVPRKSDHTFVLMAGRSYYEELMENEVKIYEYNKGHLHAKMLVVDDQFTVVGSANADIRSFDFDFEINAQIYGEEEAKKAADIFRTDLNNSKLLKLPEFRYRPMSEKFSENFCRLLSPLL